MLLSLPEPSSAELGLAAHFSTYLAFSGCGLGEDESGEEEACVVWLNNAAAAIQRRQLQQQQEQEEQKQEENEQERQAWEGLYMLVKLEAALRAPTRARIQSELAQVRTEAARLAKRRLQFRLERRAEHAGARTRAPAFRRPGREQRARARHGLGVARRHLAQGRLLLDRETHEQHDCGAGLGAREAGTT